MPRGNANRRDPKTLNPTTRPTLVSKSLSRLLRHAAEQERIPIDAHGWVRVDHLLAWRGLGKFEPRVEIEEVLGVVRGDGKGRYGLRYEGRGGAGSASVDGDGEGAEVEVEGETVRALRVFDEGVDREAKDFLIRANQGHSMKGVSEEGLLTAVVLPEEQQAQQQGSGGLPKTVVHGTFYGAWQAILSEGVLKSMRRNHVHFSGGPALDVVRGVVADHGAASIAESTANGATQKPKKSTLKEMMASANVKSGMRPDAEVLIYVDIEKSLREGMKWWRSENGVLLSDGLPISPSTTSDDTKQRSVDGGDAAVEDDTKVQSKGRGRVKPPQAQVTMGISPEFWIEVVEVKEGLGTLWKGGEMVKELPERLKGKALPIGKGRRGGGGGGGGGRGGRGNGRPRVNVERERQYD